MTFLALIGTALAVALLLVPTAASAQRLPVLASLSRAQVEEDLAVLRDGWAVADKSLSREERPAFDTVVREALGRADRITPSEFYLEVSRAMATAQNAHSRPQAPAWLETLPVRAGWFADGLYILQAQPEFERLLGGRIERFGVLPTEEALRRVTAYIGGPPSRVRDLSAEQLLQPAMLKAIGATTGEAAEVELSIVLRAGKRQKVRLPPLTPQAADRNTWTNVLSEAPRRPVAFRSSEDVASQWLLAPQPTLYIQINTLAGDGPGDGLGPQALPLMNIIDREVLPKKPKYVVIDLRRNGGGNFFNAQLFARLIPHLLPRDGRVFVLVGPKTFSAAIVTTAILKASGGNRTLIVGQAMGDGPHFWAEPRIFILPNSKIVVPASLKEHDWANGCVDLERCFYGNVALGSPGVSLEPEITADQTFADYVSGRDPALDHVLRIAK